MQKHENTETQKHTHTDSDEYSIVAFCKNATIKIMYAIYISNYWSCHLTSKCYILLIECAHVTDLNGYGGLCYMTGEVWHIIAM